MKKLKETLSKALNSFEGKGLRTKNGRFTFLYKLLTGSYSVGAEVKKASLSLEK
jgi:chemotaxis protein MotB